MKRFFLLASAALFFSFASFAQTTISAPFAVDVRSLSMGGFHYCDFLSPYMVQVNPSSLTAVGKKTLLPSLSMDFGGPLSSMPSIISATKDSDDIMHDILTEVLSSVSSSNGVFVDLDMSLPLNFARINNNKGFGIFNRVYGKTHVPSLSKAALSAGAELFMVYSSAIPIVDLKGFRLSLGTGTKLLGRMETDYSGTPNDLEKIDFSSLPLKGTVAFGMDAAVTLTVLDMISLCAVWHDVYAGIQGDIGVISDISFSASQGNLDLMFDKGKLGLGVALHIPTGFTKGVVSSLSLYADLYDFLPFFEDEDAFSKSPLLSFSAGMEVVVFKTISLRVGMNGPYLAAGAGIDLTPFHIEVALYGKELGLSAGDASQLHGAISFSLYF